MRKGFTLIELLVVISILAILSTIGLAVFGGTTAKARDSIRKNDITQLGTALELYLQKNNKYVIGTDSCANATFDTAIAPFMPSGVPKDPKTRENYCYKSNVDGTSYSLTATLDDETLYELKSEDQIASSGGGGSCTQTIAQICGAAGKNCGSFSGSGVCSSVSGSCGACSGTTPTCTNNICTACVPDGSCTAATPACGRTTHGIDNCGACSKTGSACMPNCTLSINGTAAPTQVTLTPFHNAVIQAHVDGNATITSAVVGQSGQPFTQQFSGLYIFNANLAGLGNNDTLSVSVSNGGTCSLTQNIKMSEGNPNCRPQDSYGISVKTFIDQNFDPNQWPDNSCGGSICSFPRFVPPDWYPDLPNYPNVIIHAESNTACPSELKFAVVVSNPTSLSIPRTVGTNSIRADYHVWAEIPSGARFTRGTCYTATPGGPENINLVRPLDTSSVECTNLLFGGGNYGSIATFGFR